MRGYRLSDVVDPGLRSVQVPIGDLEMGEAEQRAVYARALIDYSRLASYLGDDWDSELFSRFVAMECGYHLALFPATLHLVRLIAHRSGDDGWCRLSADELADLWGEDEFGLVCMVGGMEEVGLVQVVGSWCSPVALRVTSLGLRQVG